MLEIRFLQRGVQEPGGHAGVRDVGEVGGEGLVAAVGWAVFGERCVVSGVS